VSTANGLEHGARAVTPGWRVAPWPRRASHVVARNLVVYRRAWPVLVTGFAEPVFYLLGIGLGLGGLVGRLAFAGHELTYARFVAPGMLASAAMNGAILDSTYNLFFKLKVEKTYEAVLATPLSVPDVALGELGWAVMRGAAYSAAFLAVAAAMGLVGSAWALMCVPAATLVSFAFGAVGMLATSFMRSWQDLDSVTLALVPLFLFSGTFYPVGVYPSWLATIVGWTPLYQGVVLERGLQTGFVSLALVPRAAYLAALGALALGLATRRLRSFLAS